MARWTEHVLRAIPGAYDVVASWKRQWKARTLHGRSASDVFASIYDTNAWGDAESVSGSGSNLERTALVRAQLPDLLKRLQVRTLLDIPCGDFHWMQQVDLSGIQYLGADLVPALIERNRQQYARPSVRFEVLDLTRDALPQVDLVLCRDCLVHLSHAEVELALRNLRASGSTWLLTTTFPGVHRNEDIATGQWRMIDLTRPPFRLPDPVERMHEGHPDPRYATKSLGLWRIADLPV